VRERARRVVSALAAPFSVGGDVRQVVLGRVERVSDDGCEHRRESPQAAFLPRQDRGARGGVVDDGGPRLGEGKSPSGALTAGGDRPGGGGAAARATRAGEQVEAARTRFAELRASAAAHDAPCREHEIEEHRSTVAVPHADSRRVG
jgi:hypothetical protein